MLQFGYNNKHQSVTISYSLICIVILVTWYTIFLEVPSLDGLQKIENGPSMSLNSPVTCCLIDHMRLLLELYRRTDVNVAISLSR